MSECCILYSMACTISRELLSLGIIRLTIVVKTILLYFSTDLSKAPTNYLHSRCYSLRNSHHGVVISTMKSSRNKLPIHQECTHTHTIFQYKPLSIPSIFDLYYNLFVAFRRLACLKYLVLANMLMKSGINPFDSQEVCILCVCVILSP